MLRCALTVFLAWATLTFAASNPPAPAASALAGYDRAEAPPAKTSLLFNAVVLTTTGFERKAEAYETGYTAKVSPLSFLGETGRLTIAVSDDQLRQLARGEAVNFTGKAVSKKGDTHAVTGTAIPADKTTGQLRVRVATTIVDLKFETTYRFMPAALPGGP